MRTRLPALALAALLAGSLAGCASEPPAEAAAAPSPPPAAPSVPLEVRRDAGQVSLQVLLTLPDGKSYPFAVDTGAQQSSIEATVAARLRLPVKGEFLLRGVTGTKRTRTAAVKGWRLGDQALPPATVVLTELPPDLDPDEPRLAGLLGSDVLSSFGSITVDYEDGRLLLGPP